MYMSSSGTFAEQAMAVIRYARFAGRTAMMGSLFGNVRE
jgi:hypothetical protein